MGSGARSATIREVGAPGCGGPVRCGPPARQQVPLLEVGLCILKRDIHPCSSVPQAPSSTNPALTSFSFGAPAVYPIAPKVVLFRPNAYTNISIN